MTALLCKVAILHSEAIGPHGYRLRWWNDESLTKKQRGSNKKKTTKKRNEKESGELSEREREREREKVACESNWSDLFIE